MAEYLTITEARLYPLPNGSTVDLVALVGNLTLADGKTYVTPESVGDLNVGQVVYGWAMNEFRQGVVVKTGRTKVTVAFTTAGAIKEAMTYRQGEKVRVGVQAIPLEHIRYQAPQLTPDMTADDVANLGEIMETALAESPVPATPEETAAAQAEVDTLLAEATGEPVVVPHVASTRRDPREERIQTILDLPITAADLDGIEGAPVLEASPLRPADTVFRVEFERIGRRTTREIEPLAVTVAAKDARKAAGILSKEIGEHAKKYLIYNWAFGVSVDLTKGRVLLDGGRLGAGSVTSV